MKLYRFTRSIFAVLVLVFVVSGPSWANIWWQNNQFVIDSARPAWIGPVAHLPVGPNQSRDHVVSFEDMQNDLAVMLNQILAQGVGSLAQARLVAVTDALFPFSANERAAMQNARNMLLQAIQNNNINNYQALAQTLLSRMNSSPDNVRVGNAGINAAISQSLDANFLPGLVNFNGVVSTANGNVPFNGQALRLTNAHEVVVYQYQLATMQNMNFVVNGINGAHYPGISNGVQLSSTQLPTVVPPQPNHLYPVIVFGPAQQNVPLLYQ